MTGCMWFSVRGRSAACSRLCSRNGASRSGWCRGAGRLGWAEGIDWRPADAADLDAASDAAKGAAVIYQCLNAPYAQWPERFPPLQRGVLAAAERAGALLVSLENLYSYGSTGGRPMTEDLPLAATTVKGRTRAAMTGELLAAAERRPGSDRDRAGLGFLRRRRHPGLDAR